MTGGERRAVSALAGIFWLRMFGLFLLLPVLAPYAKRLAGSTPLLVGAAVGAYGLTQAMLQIPFGMMSDRFGRKPVIIAGLLVFAAGSVVAALADTIVAVVAGRALQGAGAIAAAVLALTADLTREAQRAKAMAVIGVSIGIAFFAALLLSPPLTGLIGVPGLFWMTAVLAIGAIAIVVFLVPVPAGRSAAGSGVGAPGEFFRVLRDRQLIGLDIGIFVLHCTLTALFVVIPLDLVARGFPTDQHWRVYIPVLVLSVIAMAPFVLLSTRPQWIRRNMVIAVLLLILSQLSMMTAPVTIWALGAMLVLFFWGFNLLEAMLPSLVSRVAPSASKGAALGVYNTSEFLGVFVGGVGGGWTYGMFGAPGTFLFCTGLLVLWLMLIWSAPAMRLSDSRILDIEHLANLSPQDIADRLTTVPGVLEATVVADEGVALLKVDQQLLDEDGLRRAITS